ncbi:tetratricopeptide repeat protein [Sungkyunkwania multivorans]|uniref:Tetratricopeptide repeat protein n=1 Tax=Sungkyunkwania multivorans TaxID=1173618 RepID=A0ABW3CW53_9FLAO
MKKTILIASALLLGTFSFAQKKELKSVEKALKSGKAAEARTTLDGIQGMIDGADDKYKAQYYFLKGKTMNNLGSYKEAVSSLKEAIAFEESKGMNKYTGEARTILNEVAGNLVNSAIEDNKSKKYGEAAEKLYMAYEVDTNNQDYLYYAASSAVNGSDYEKALEYYLKLKDLGYTGVVTEYYATDAATGEKAKFNSETERDLMVKAKSHVKPENIDSESRLPEIVKNIALIYSQQGKVEEAIAAAKEARESNPDDMGLLLTEANLYIKLDKKDKFKELMTEAVQKDPNNPDLHYNIGVISMQQGNMEEARATFQKVLSLKPSYTNAALNLSTTYVDEGNALIEEMNKLGNSRADNAKYDTLKKKKDSLFRKGADVLEDLVANGQGNNDILNQLKGIYGALGDNENFMRVKKMIQE